MSCTGNLSESPTPLFCIMDQVKKDILFNYITKRFGLYELRGSKRKSHKTFFVRGNVVFAIVMEDTKRFYMCESDFWIIKKLFGLDYLEIKDVFREWLELNHGYINFLVSPSLTG